MYIIYKLDTGDIVATVAAPSDIVIGVDGSWAFSGVVYNNGTVELSTIAVDALPAFFNQSFYKVQNGVLVDRAEDPNIVGPLRVQFRALCSNYCGMQNLQSFRYDFPVVGPHLIQSDQLSYLRWVGLGNITNAKISQGNGTALWYMRVDKIPAGTGDVSLSLTYNQIRDALLAYGENQTLTMRVMWVLKDWSNTATRVELLTLLSDQSAFIARWNHERSVILG